MFAVEPKKLPSYLFGPFVLDGDQRLLLLGNEVVALAPKVLDTLIILVENHGRVLTKNELMDALWPDAFVEESSLSQNISLLRKALGKSGSDTIFIETIPKRGYRFVAQVREVETESIDRAVSLYASQPRIEAVSQAFLAAEQLRTAEFSEVVHVSKWRTGRMLALVLCLLAGSAG